MQSAIGSWRDRIVAHRGMGSLVIDMHKRALHVGEYLDLVLQLLADVMRFPQRCVCIHDDVDLDKIVLSQCQQFVSDREDPSRTGPLCNASHDQRLYFLKVVTPT